MKHSMRRGARGNEKEGKGSGGMAMGLHRRGVRYSEPQGGTAVKRERSCKSRVGLAREKFLRDP